MAAACGVAACGDDDGAPAVRTEPFEQTRLRAPGESGTVKETSARGDDSAYGGAGAWWTRKGQLVAYSKKRILRIRVVGIPAKRRAAVRLGKLGFRRLSAPAS